MEYIVSNASITEAWKKVRSNKGAPGVDGISIEKFPKLVRPQWNDIKRQLLEGDYVPSPTLRVEIPKESGGVRRLGIPRVLDRVLMQAIAKVLGEIFNPTFSDNSFGYMPHRSVQQAARRAQSKSTYFTTSSNVLLSPPHGFLILASANHVFSRPLPV
ncbi:MAG: hypothetical protein ABW166_05180 [Sedimenticola sp.]